MSKEMVEAPTLALRGDTQAQGDNLPTLLTANRKEKGSLDGGLSILVEDALPAPVAALALLGLGPCRAFLLWTIAPAIGLATGAVVTCRAVGRRARRPEVPL